MTNVDWRRGGVQKCSKSVDHRWQIGTGIEIKSRFSKNALA